METPAYFSIKNFDRYQHYHQRRPPWVKLYQEILTDYTLRQCPPLTRLVHVLLFLIASECENHIPFDLHYLSERVGFPITQDIVTPLFNAGLLLASSASTIRKQHASTSRERVETEKKSPVAPFIPDSDWIAELSSNPAYVGLNIQEQAAKCQTWCKTSRKLFSKRRLVNWLNRAEKPLTLPTPTRKTRDLSTFGQDTPTVRTPPSKPDSA